MCDIPWYRAFPRNPFIINISMYFRANFALDIDDVSRAGVNHGARLMYFDLTFTSRNGNDSLNAVIYNIINLEYAKFEHSVLKISLKSVLINLFWKVSMFTALNDLLLCLLLGDFFSLPRKIQKVPKWSATSLMMIPELYGDDITGLTRPVFVTVMEYSSPVLDKGAIRAAGVSSEMIPTRSSAERRKPVDRSGLVGSQNKTDQPVLTGSDEDQVGTVPTGPVGPDIIIDRIQPVAEGPVGQFSTRRPVGTDGMFPTSDSDQPTADGPLWRLITHIPVGPDRITSAYNPDRPVADGPVGQSFIVGPVGPRRMFSPYELNQPVTVGPVDQPFTTSPVGTHEGEPDCKWTDQISESPVGSTEILDRVKQTEGPSRTDFAKSGIVNEPASSGDTPPSSDSGVHSLENMSKI